MDGGGGAFAAATGLAKPRLSLWDRILNWRNRRVAAPAFQAWAARHPLTRRRTRRSAEALHDLVAGFVYSQTLAACFDLGVFELLADGPRTAEDLAPALALDPFEAERLLAAAAAVGLLAPRSRGRWGLAELGAAAMGAAGVREMVRHHRLLYRDLADPVALLRGESEPETARFWSYTSGAPDVDPAEAGAYSALMAVSQAMVAEETLAAVDLSRASSLLDVGGGEGAFAAAALRANPGLRATVFDLPSVVARAPARFAAAGVEGRAETRPGSFLEEDLPEGHDVLSLVRVLYDHPDERVRVILSRVRKAMAPGARLIVTEPMSGGRRPTRSGDAYFGLYLAAMRSGRARSPARHAELLSEAGFTDIRRPRVGRSFITEVVTARAG
ncbi:MAG TPA: methyltransferase [Paracoccaceae bacterium]|nr:methyltransferase [Paracoccaceae bacterium]